MARLLVVLACLITLGAAPASAQSRAQGEAYGEAHGDEPRLVAAIFRSDLCGPCRILEPRITDLAREFDGRPVEFVRLDFTFGDRARLRERAEAEGIYPAYRDHRGSTGFMLLIDRETGDILARITARYSEAEIRRALAYALSITGRREDFGL